MKDLESIKSLAERLARVIDPASNATRAEQEIARDKLQRLLEKHGLTAEALADEVLHLMPFEARDKEHLRLWAQCAMQVLNRNKIEYRQIEQRGPSRRKGKKGPLKRYLLRIEVTLVQNADLRACYDYYSALLARAREDIDEDIALLQQKRKHLVSAMIHRYDISSQLQDEDDGKPISPAKLQAILAAMRGLRGSRWEKPTGNLGTGVLALPGGAQVA